MQNYNQSIPSVQKLRDQMKNKSKEEHTTHQTQSHSSVGTTARSWTLV